MKIIEVNEEFIEMMKEYRKPDKTVGLIEASSKNVIVFLEKMIGFIPYAWQVYYLNKVQIAIQQRNFEKTRNLIKEFVALTSRQIGKSTALAGLGIWLGSFNKCPGTIMNNTIFGITSASESQSKKLLNEMKKLIRFGDTNMALNYRDDNDKPIFGKRFFSDLLDDEEPNNMTTITFKAHKPDKHGPFLLAGSKSGSVIKSYPPTSVVLGETFTVVGIDEAGKSDKISDMFFYDYIYPTGNSTNAVRLYTSTPWFNSGFFYRLVDPDSLYEDSPADVVVFTIEAIRIENPNYYATVMKTIDMLNKDGKTDEVQRAYYCRFVKGDQNYFNPDKIWKLFNEDTRQVMFEGPCDMGVDFGGQVKSKTVITISTLNDEDHAVRLYHKSYEVGKDGALLDDMADLMTRFNIQRVIPDDCPQGDYMIRAMKERGWDVQPMNFRAEKVKKYGAFRSWLNKGKIKSYKDDDLKTEMLAMEYSARSKQSVIQHAPGYSDDLIDSFVMSCYFYVTEDEGFKTYDLYD